MGKRNTQVGVESFFAVELWEFISEAHTNTRWTPRDALPFLRNSAKACSEYRAIMSEWNSSSQTASRINFSSSRPKGSTISLVATTLCPAKMPICSIGILAQARSIARSMSKDASCYRRDSNLSPPSTKKSYGSGNAGMSNSGVLNDGTKLKKPFKTAFS